MKCLLTYIAFATISIAIVFMLLETQEVPPEAMSEILLFLIISAGAGLFLILPACAAHAKGRSFFAWLIFCIFLWPIALVSSLLISTDYEALRRRKGGRSETR